MLRFALLPALLLLTVPAACRQPTPAAQAAEPHFPTLTGRVVDQADLLSPQVEARLAAQSEAVEREIGPQYVIVTVSSLHGLAIEDYGVKLGRRWGIGSKARNDGLLLIVAPHENVARIEVGYGLEKRVTDAFAARVMREKMVPRFKAGDFPGGIEAGSAELVRRLRSKQTDREIAVEDRMVI
ncbi:MAG: methanol dehydrogenase [Alphaproteobacteria bacterium]|nr:methanol dehydrogenase [Alphaproteobacteria bacterium]